MFPTFSPRFRDSASTDQQYTYVTTIGNHCYLRARDAQGVPCFVDVIYEPTYYLPTSSYSGISSFDGLPLAPHTCASIREGRDFLKAHPDAYGNIQCEYMLLSDVYGDHPVEPDMDRLLLWNIDIETPGEQFAPVDDPFNPVTTITVIKRHLGQRDVVVYGLESYTPAEGVTFHRCASEEDLLSRFLADWRNKGNYPDIVTGWNVQFYDIPYLVNRIRRLWPDDTRVLQQLSPFRQLSTRQVEILDQLQTVVDIRGIAILDYLELYKKFTYAQRESYRLDHIAHVELGERKVSYKEYQSLAHLYRENYQKFIDYNIKDVELVDRLDEKLKLIELVCALAYSAKANFVDTFKQVRLWDIMIYHYLRAQGKQIPARREQHKDSQYSGGFVRPTQVGLHKWICSFDVASMYPHIIREWNLSPETLIGRKVSGVSDQTLLNGLSVGEYLADGDHVPEGYAMAANGVLTRRDVEGFLPAMLKTLYDERVRFKELASTAKRQREGLDKTDPQYAVLTKQIAAFNNQQLVRKVNLNSAYGALGSQYFRFYDTDMAEGVTITGRFVIQTLIRQINAFLHRLFPDAPDEDYIIASDTDSVYVRLDRVAQRYIAEVGTDDPHRVTKFLDKFCQQQMQKVIDHAFVTIAERLNVYMPCLSMKREVIAERGVWTAKKKYILNVYDTEGVHHQEPKLKMVGVEPVKSSTPSIVREYITDAILLLMRGTQEDVWTYVASKYEEFAHKPFEDVAFPKGVNGLEKYATAEKGVPFHVRGALVFNRRIAAHPEYGRIIEGQKIKYAYLREPNPFHSNVLSAPDGCPAEWNIEQYIDYRTQWEIAFIDPLHKILNAAGWSVEYQETLF